MPEKMLIPNMGARNTWEKVLPNTEVSVTPGKMVARKFQQYNGKKVVSNTWNSEVPAI